MQHHPAAVVSALGRTKTWDEVPMSSDLLAPRGMHAICGSGSSALGEKEEDAVDGALWHLPDTESAVV